MPVQSGTSDHPYAAEGPSAPGHLGDLTRIISADLVDTAIDTAGAAEKRLRRLPTRVVVYLVLAGALLTGTGYRQVYTRLAAGKGNAGRAPGSSALSQAIRRIGVAPLRELFNLVRGPAAGTPRWRGLLVCAIDGTTMSAADTTGNAAAFGRPTGRPGAAGGYPMLRLVTLVACGTRTVLDAVFGPLSIGETRYAPRLLAGLQSGMLLLGDRNFAAAALIDQIANTGADLLIRCKQGRKLTTVTPLPDGTYIACVGTTDVRVIDADITTTAGPDGPRRTGRYRLLTTLLDHHAYPARDVVALYHQRWEIETSYRELKSTLTGGQVLRARTPAGVAQEVYAALIVHHALRTALADTALADPAAAPDRLSFTIALATARNTLGETATRAAPAAADLAGHIGRAALANVLPPRRARSSPRVVKRAISKHRAKGHVDRTNYRIHITTRLLADP